jgi:hypothetical protein
MTRSFQTVLIAFMAFIFALFLCFAVQACQTAQYSDWRADVEKRNVGVPLIESVMTGDKLMEFVSAYNESPPKSDRKADSVAVWIHQGMLAAHLSRQLFRGQAPTALVVWIGEGGCIDNTEVIPLIVMDKLLSGVPFNSKASRESY